MTMSNKHTWTAVLATVAAVCLPLSSLGQLDGMTLDQSNDNFGYYFYDASSIWQSFTAGMDGHLRAIQAHIYATNDAPWTATFEIREGQGTAGTLLASQTIAGDGVKQQRTFVLENPVRQVSGATYSFVVRNASTGLTVRASADLYAGGRSHHANYDYNFMTWVLASNWSDPAWRDTTFTSGSTVITTPEQLAQFAWLVNDGTSFTGQRIVLAADIDLGAHYWTPAGTDAARFDGTFDGAGHTISGLLIEHPGVDCQGLFGVTGSNSSIEDVALLDADVRGGTYTGGIVGRSYGEVRRCRAAGTVAGGSMGGRRCGTRREHAAGVCERRVGVGLQRRRRRGGRGKRRDRGVCQQRQHRRRQRCRRRGRYGQQRAAPLHQQRHRHRPDGREHRRRGRFVRECLHPRVLEQRRRRRPGQRRRHRRQCGKRCDRPLREHGPRRRRLGRRHRRRPQPRHDPQLRQPRRRGSPAQWRRRRHRQR